ncbi:MAG: hypothetical protein EXQ83_08380 [Xanthobacteraceae bacterium]|nr:hypothetical protein [Xanthobacteraceae bacterium]
MLSHGAGRRGLAALVRSRPSSQEVFILAAVLCAAAPFAFEFEFFENADQMTSDQRRISV